MSLPTKTNPKWEEIVTGKRTYTLKFLGAKILLGRLIRTIDADPSPHNISVAVNELHALYSKNVTIQSAKDDLRTIFG
ncbi:hypothetical protein [Desulfogranum marinum]|uniref:hypothetical protein n=1 Tax=Desulfogranum marinum TaxID=453220 RepID=UPI001E5ECA2D|nr:hypothetical protein [Desulfogranum marinum]